MAGERLSGDLREREDGGFDGWCWSADRPDQRLVVDLLIDDTLAVSMVAAIFRRDLMTGGFGDGRHGFLMRLPPDLAARGGEQLITARERRSGQVFGRVLRQAPGRQPVGGSRLEAQAQATEALGLRLEAAHAARQSRAQPAGRWREALALLGEQLADRAGAPRRAGRLAAALPLVLPNPATPALSLVLVADDAVATWRRAAALAPALAELDGELVVVDPGPDPAASSLPERLVHLRYARGMPLGALPAAASVARGRLLLLLADPPPAPSSAALLHLAAAIAARPAGLWFGPAAMAALAGAGLPSTRAALLPGRLGLALCLPRPLLAELGPPDPSLAAGGGLHWADMVFKARLLGVPVYAADEPAAAGAAPTQAEAPAAAAAIRRAHAAFQHRWGAAPGPSRAEWPA